MMAAAAGLLAAAAGGLQCNLEVLPPPPFQNFTQPVDHADPSGPTFNQRYQVLDHWYKPGGPVLFYAGPENEASLYTLACLALPGHAKALNAVIIGPEHRYFGPSRPEHSDTWAGLTLDNVIADYAAIISSFTAAGGKYAGAKVIVFGGSYGGFLSMLMRVRHPELVAGSVASAAPTQLYGSGIPDGTWFDTVADIYQTQDAACAAKVSAAFAQLMAVLDAGNFTQAQTDLNLCRAPTVSSKKTLAYYVAHGIWVNAQFNYPSHAANKIGNPFNAVCDQFLSAGAWEAMKFSMDVGYNKTDKMTCYWPAKLEAAPPASLRGGPAVAALGPGQLPALGDINFELSWYYITCTYFVMPIAMGQKAAAWFHFDWPFSYDGLSDYCYRKFKVRPQKVPAFLPAELANTSNIIFSNMGFDPVKGFSVQKSVSPSVTLLFVNLAGHTQDIIAPDTGDSQDVTAARAKELATISQWLG